MLIEKIIIFALFLGPLIFFHELGHYLFARLFGVRVEVFSIGFGPKLFKLKKGSTEYAFSLIPLGGYIKMFGDDPFEKDSIPENEREHSFTHKGKMARFWIVLGGPLANVLMAFGIFFILLLTGEKIPEFKLGIVPPTSKFYQLGLRSGDIIKKVNQKVVYNPSDVILDGKSLINSIEVTRASNNIEVKLNSTGKEFFDELKKYPPILRKPIVVNSNGERFALSESSSRIDWKKSLEEMGDFHQIKKLYVFKVLSNKEKVDNEFVTETSPPRAIDISFNSHEELFHQLAAKGYRTLDLSVKSVKKNSAADKGGVLSGDIIIAVDNDEIFGFEDLKGKIKNSKSTRLLLTVWRKGQKKDIVVEPKVDKGRKIIGVEGAHEFISSKYVETESKNVFEALILACSRTYNTVSKTIDGFVKLITAEVSLKNIGGPIAIGKVAADSFHLSLSYFFQIMAIISINLGVINLFPIPVLDGGHIMFIFLEAINGGPLSRRKMEIAQQVGLSLLLMLIVGALFNDFYRFLS